MFSTYELYQFLEEERLRILERFKKVGQNHLYYVAAENTWSPELIFRHLLFALKWISDYLPGGSIELPKYAMEWETTPEEKVTIDELIQSFKESSEIIKDRLEKLTNEEDEELMEAWMGKKPRQRLIQGLIEHEQAHLGQITWIFKRSTGWTDKETYEMED